MTASTPTSESAALTRSRRPAPGSRYSGNSAGPSSSRASIAGTAIRNTDPHQKRSSSAPPSTGPTAVPAENTAAHTPMARPRCLGSTNMCRIRARVEGSRVAPATPSRARVAMSIPALLAKAAITDATPNVAAPASSRRRRPIRSPSVPIVINEPATRKP